MIRQRSHVIFDFSGSTALVTGAAGDIGRAAAVRLAQSGARIALSDLPSSEDGLRESADRCAEHVGADAVQIVMFDVTDSVMVEAGFAEVAGQLGVPDLVFNNAGFQGAFVGTADYPIDDARKVLDVNVIGVINVLGAAARQLRSAGEGGAIVNSASMAGVSGAPDMIAYCASKGAVISLTKAAARDLAPLNIRVNAVSPALIGPGAMWTRQVELQAKAGNQYFSSDPARVAGEMIAQVPMRRLGSLEEVASVVSWLLSSDASYVTGENILITGGIV
jgi:NAD(P)-dependent dehydrogenase (short-subunit alcohol dehydrogenase family)